jgi:hypothetical protein
MENIICTSIKEMIIDVYSFSIEDSILVYGYFLVDLLFPLLVYDIYTNHENKYRFVMLKSDKFNPLLEQLFPNRIEPFGEPKNDLEREFVNLNTTKTGIYHIWDYYCKVHYLDRQNKLPMNTLVLYGYGMFYDPFYQFTKQKYSLLSDVDYNEQMNLYAIQQYIQSENKSTYKQKQILKSNKYKRMQLFFISHKNKVIQYLLSIPALPIPKKKILYVLRRLPTKYVANVDGGGIRFIENENNLINILIHLFGDENVKVAIMEDYAFVQQVQLFYNADIVVGQHGSGLTNAIFMRPNTTLIEMSGTINIDNHIFRNIAETFQINYIHISQKQLSKQSAINYFNSLSYEDEIAKENVMQLIEKYFTTNVYKNLKGYDKMFYPAPIQTIQNSGTVNETEFRNKLKHLRLQLNKKSKQLTKKLKPHKKQTETHKTL